MKMFEYLMSFYSPNLGITGALRVNATDYQDAMTKAQQQIRMTDLVTGGKWSPEEVERQRQAAEGNAKDLR